MKFELTQRIRYTQGDSYEFWDWTGTVQGDTVVAGPETYNTEAEARSAIAKARKAMAGAKFAKVVVSVDDAQAPEQESPVQTNFSGTKTGRMSCA